VQDGDRARKATRLEADLAAEQARQARLDRTLTEVDELDPDRGWWGWFGATDRTCGVRLSTVVGAAMAAA
jgi:hypothetical protein